MVLKELMRIKREQLMLERERNLLLMEILIKLEKKKRGKR